MDPKKPKVVVNLYAGDWNMFSATTTVYNRKAITIFKECVGRIYDPQKKAWLFPNTNYTYLIEQLARCDVLEIGATIPREYLDKILMKMKFIFMYRHLSMKLLLAYFIS